MRWLLLIKFQESAQINYIQKSLPLENSWNQQK